MIKCTSSYNVSDVLLDVVINLYFNLFFSLRPSHSRCTRFVIRLYKAKHSPALHTRCELHARFYRCTQPNKVLKRAPLLHKKLVLAPWSPVATYRRIGSFDLSSKRFYSVKNYEPAQIEMYLNCSL